MNPYLIVPVALPGDENLGNKDKVVNGKILPGNVIAYHEGYSWGTLIYLTTGQAFMLDMTVPQYEEAVRKYWLEMGKRASTKILQPNR